MDKQGIYQKVDRDRGIWNLAIVELSFFEQLQLDMMEVISSRLIIPEPNRSCGFFYFDLPSAVIE